MEAHAAGTATCRAVYNSLIFAIYHVTKHLRAIAQVTQYISVYVRTYITIMRESVPQ